MARPQRINLKSARRLALTAQGFSGAAPEPGKATRWQALSKVIDRLNLLQIDSVNVLSRSHYLPLFSRLGSYDKSILDRHTLAAKNRRCFEYWAHEASILPYRYQPLLRWRMDDARNGTGIYKGLVEFARDKPQVIAETLARVRAEGPLRPRDFGQPAVRSGEWWGWNDHKTALEYLFWTGDVTTASRDGFERLYDVPERVLPADTHSVSTPDRADAIRDLARHSARALGISTETDIRDYFRLPVADARQAVADLVENGELHMVEVKGWNKPGYIWHQAKSARSFDHATVLSPFDPLVWNRDRAERLFDFRYRIEIYTPAPKREFGYYVLPVLIGEQLAGRLCMKADRQAGTLRINAAWHEDGVNPTTASQAIAPALHTMSRWLELERVEITGQGNMATALQGAV
ncbi:MAG: winged helix-turn-helix domain-containing protein [Anderseniella sp.]